MMDTATAARAVQGRMLGANVRFARVTTDSFSARRKGWPNEKWRQS